MTLRIALTGATGFVGGAIVLRLMAEGHQVRALVRSPETAALPDAVVKVRGDLDDHDALADLNRNVDVLLHVAGAIQGLKWADFFKVNFEGTRNVVNAAAAAGVKRVVYVSSLAARRPEISSYAASKRAAEDFLLGLNLPVLILRPAAVYGEGDMATLPLLKALMARVGVLPGRASNRFSLVHVDDLAGVCVDALCSDVTGMREIDDGHGGYQWRDLVAVTQGTFGRPGFYMHLPKGLAMVVGHVADGLARVTGTPLSISADKMREMYQPDWVAEGPGWPRAPQVNLAQGLKRTIGWYQARGMLPHTKSNDLNVAE